jgi:hypothetical protein
LDAFLFEACLSIFFVDLLWNSVSLGSLDWILKQDLEIGLCSTPVFVVRPVADDVKHLCFAVIRWRVLRSDFHVSDFASVTKTCF